MSRIPAQPTPHLFETPAAETFFKALLWVVVILQAILLGREYNRNSQHARHATPPAQHHPHR
jgi:hypothetical protein